MTIDSLSEIVAKSLSIPDLSKLTVTDRDKSQGHKKAVASLIPYVGGAAAEELQMYYDYKDDEFFRKFVGYLMELKETTAEERNRFAQDVQEIAEDFSGNVICGMVDRLDNINKEKAFAKLTVARIHGLISIKDFFRLHSLLERIQYMDLKENEEDCEDILVEEYHGVEACKDIAIPFSIFCYPRKNWMME